MVTREGSGGRRDTADAGLMTLGNREDTEGEGRGNLEKAPSLLSEVSLALADASN